MPTLTFKKVFTFLGLVIIILHPLSLFAEDLRELYISQEVEITKKITGVYTAGYMQEPKKTKIKKGLLATIDQIHPINIEIGPGQRKVGFSIYVNSRKGRFKIDHTKEISLISSDRASQNEQINLAFEELAHFDGFKAFRY